MKNMKDIEKIAKEFIYLTESEKENRKNAIDMNLILNSDLKTIKEKYECQYIVDENDKLIFIDVNARPIKGGLVEYSARCDLRTFLEEHDKETDIIVDKKEEIKKEEEKREIKHFLEMAKIRKTNFEYYVKKLEGFIAQCKEGDEEYLEDLQKNIQRYEYAIREESKLISGMEEQLEKLK